MCSRRLSNRGVRPLKLTVREQRYMRLASAIFIVLITINVIFAPFGAFTAPRVSTLLVYLVLSYLLWRRSRVGAFAGVLVALAGAALMGGAIFFLWSMVQDQLAHLPGALEVIVTMFLPCLFNLLIVVVLVRALLSNKRLERP